MGRVTVAGSSLDVTRPFSRARALAGGLTLKELRRVGYRTVFTGVYLSSAVELTPELRARAALVPFPEDAMLSRSSAARVLGIPVPTDPREHVTVFRQRDRRHRPGIACHLAGRAQFVTVDGMRVTGPAQTFADLAGDLGLVETVIVGDHLVTRGDVSLERLRAFCDERGSAAARRAVAFVRERVDSPMETRARMLLVLAGLPEPEINPEIRDENGYLLRRYDLYYRRSRTVVEYDGRQHVERTRQWESDVDRRTAIDDAQDRMVVLIAKDIYSRPSATLARIHRILRERGEPGVPVRLSDDWRPHFPER